MILMIMTMLLTSLAITREREAGTIEQLVVTPLKPWQLMLGKMLPFTIIGFVDVIIILVVALLISTISKTQQQAIFVVLLFLNPAILLSGLMFPIANMPLPVQYLTYINPLRYFLVIMRGVILKGNGFTILADQFFALFALGIVFFTVAVSRFHRNLE